MDVTNSPGVCAFSLAGIMGIYCILWLPLTVGMRAVLRLREYTILMHIYTMRFMHAKL